MNDHIVKPIDPEHLFSVLLHWIKSFNPSPIAEPAASDTLDNLHLLEGLSDIDVSAGLARVLGNRKLYCRLLKDFVRHQSNAIAQLQNALANNAPNSIFDLAHGLKGVAGNLSLTRVYDIASALEAAGRNADQPAMIANIAALDTALQTLMPVLAQLNILTEPPALCQNLPIETVCAHFEQLLELLEQGDTRATQVLTTLIPELPKNLQADAAHLAELLADYELKTAWLIAQQMHAQLSDNQDY
jgi:two-component system sensor histidine kinase/response regulator